MFECPLSCRRALIVSWNPLLNAGIASIAIALQRPVTDIALLSGYMILATGAFGPFTSALGRKYGKRPMYVFSSLMGTIGVIVCATAKSYNTLVGGRVLEGIAIAAYESLAVASIGDLYFVHERGPRVAFMMFLLAGISNGISIIAGRITEMYGWQWNFYILIPFAVAQTIAVILYCPETMYRRQRIYEIDIQGSEKNLEKLADIEEHARHVEHKSVNIDSVEVKKVAMQDSMLPPMPPKKKSYFRELSLYNGAFVDDSLFKMILACPAILFNIGAFYQIVMTGCIIAWYVAVAISGGVIFAVPPFNMKPADIGYMSAGPFIGGFLGALTCLLTAEPYIKWMTRKNKGIYEPEFWLLPLAIDGACAITGLIGYGYATARALAIPFICFTWGIMLFGMTAIATHCSQWALDSYRSNSTELFVMNMVSLPLLPSSMSLEPADIRSSGFQKFLLLRVSLLPCQLLCAAAPSSYGHIR